ncbi:hypothetical protein TWF281_007004 [Arthrobotrys megalospora]
MEDQGRITSKKNPQPFKMSHSRPPKRNTSPNPLLSLHKRPTQRLQSLHALLTCGEYTLKLLVKDGALIRIYHSLNITPIPDSETSAEFIWLFTKERERGLRKGYFDITDSPFLEECAGTPFELSSYNLKPTSDDERVLYALMEGVGMSGVNYKIGFLIFVPKDIDNGIVEVVDTDEQVNLFTGTDLVREALDQILEKAKEAVEDEEVDLEECGGMYLVEVVYPVLNKAY